MTRIAKRLRQEIQRQGVISFARFMELALYDAEAGYYERQPGVIGRSGDFYTSPCTGSLFGELLACQFAEWIDSLPEAPVQLVEAGAHDGQLAADILHWLGKNRPAVAKRLQYLIIEPSEERRAWQANKLDAFPEQVQWFSDLKALGEQAVTGIIFSNELLDSFPIRRFGWDAGNRVWFEWGVDCCNDGSFNWQQIPLASPAAVETWLQLAGLDLPESLRQVLPDGFTLEICPLAIAWWKQAAHVLKTGKLMTIDYGLCAEEFLDPRRANGTLRAYRGHHLVPDPLANPGEQDLTAHVNFTHLQNTGEAVGLRTDGLWPQSRFLTGIAKQMWAASPPAEPWSPARVRQFQTLIHPEHLGRAFRVLIQSTIGSADGHAGD